MQHAHCELSYQLLLMNIYRHDLRSYISMLLCFLHHGLIGFYLEVQSWKLHFQNIPEQLVEALLLSAHFIRRE